MSLPRKTSFLVGLDFLFACMSVYVAYLLRYDGQIPVTALAECIQYALISAIALIISSYYFKLYNRIWQYASIGELLSIFKAITISVIISTIVMNFVSSEWVSFAVVFRTFQNMILAIGGSRFIWRVYRDRDLKAEQASVPPVLIIGAGDCGTMIAKELRQNPNFNLNPIGFIDDNPIKHDHQILGLPVFGGRDQIQPIIEECQVKEVIIAIPSASQKVISEMIKICKETDAQIKIVPKLDVMIRTGSLSKQIRRVEVEDLLGREPIQVDLQGIANYVQNKVVLVTGAGGSIGSELCRQILPFTPSHLLLLGHGENSIYLIEQELRTTFPMAKLETVIADVQDRERLDQLFMQFQPEVVFHAAAHKHVPLMERNPGESIKNNVFGTKNVAELSDKYGVERFVMISTDKAVNPTSVMGATKRIAEMIVQSISRNSKTVYTAVRFGNVLGSRGSVIPRFKEQIKKGGPVTVTHPEMVRYFMTIPEAVQLVIQAGAFAKGGEVFVLDMGEPVKIVDLARDLIKLSGFEPGEDIDIVFTGIRPGEKLYEELLTQEEGTTSTVHNRIFVAKQQVIDRDEMQFQMKRLEKSLDQQPEDIKAVIKHVVPTFMNVG